jgi:hypothetical protein
MEWFEKKVAERRKAEDNRAAVAPSAEKIYEALWTEIMKDVNKALQEPDWRHSLTPNGYPQHRDVKFGARHLRIDLADDKTSIAASTSATEYGLPSNLDIRLDLKVGPDKVVYLEHKGKRFTYAEASQLILEPFLFSE